MRKTSTFNLEAIRREAAAAERERVAEIVRVAARFDLGEDFVERHRQAGSSLETVRTTAKIEDAKRLALAQLEAAEASVLVEPGLTDKQRRGVRRCFDDTRARIRAIELPAA